MKNKKSVIFSVIFVVLILSLSMISAGFFGELWAKITGKAVSYDSCVGGFTNRYDCSTVVETGASYTSMSYEELCGSGDTANYCYWDDSESGSDACKEKPCDSYMTEEECPVNYGCEWEEAVEEEEEVEEKSAIVPKELPEGLWTDWYNMDNPGDDGDFEKLNDIRNSLLYDNPCGGDNPLYVECKTTSGEDYTETGENVTCSAEKGLICKNSDNSELCSDYKVRFYCEKKEKKSTQEKCVDSDGGINLSEKGTASLSSFTNFKETDSCSYGKLLEYYCNETGAEEIEHLFYNCSEEFGSNYTCEDGACVEGVVEIPESQLEKSIISLSTGGDAPDSVNVTFEGSDYTFELMDATDTSATIRVNGVSKEIFEGNSIVINGLKFKLLLADENTAIGRLLVELELLGTSTGTSNCSSDGKCELYLNDVVSYEGYEISLVSGSDSSATISVNEKTKNIDEDSTKQIGDLMIYVKTADEDTATEIVYVSIVVSVIDSTGVNCTGCELNDKCYVIGYRTSRDYCSESGEFVYQKNETSSCSQSYECDSNICVSGGCVSVTFWENFTNWFKRLFGSKLENGEICTKDSQCESEYCYDNVCSEEVDFSFKTLS